MRTLLALVLTVWSGAAAAQFWATRDVCDVTSPQIVDAALAPLTIEALRADAARIPNSVGRFWEIRAPGGAVSYLWGTNHGNDPLILDLPARVLAEIKTARIFAPEIDWIAQSRRQIEHELTNPGVWRNRRAPNVPEGLLPGIEDNIRSRLVGVGLDRETLEYLTLPGLAEILLSSPCDDFASGIYPSQDSLLQTMSAIGGARTIGLEPPDAFMDKLSQPEHRSLALAMINLYGSYLDPVTANAGRRTEMALYLRGEIGVSMAWERRWLATRFGQEIGPALHDRVNDYLLAERNLGFLQTIRPELTRGGVFLAVGAWHLPGEDGMVAQLRAVGYEVNRVVLPGEAAGQ